MNPSYNSGSSASGVSNTSGVKPGMIASTSSDSAPEPMQLSGNSRGGKKGLLVVGLLIIVLLIVGVIVAVMMGGGKGGNNNSSGGTFNELINYVTSGDVSTADVNSEYDVKNSYYFLNGWNTEEEKSTIYTKTKDLMDKFVAGYKDGDSQVLNNLVKSTKEQFDFIYVVEMKEEVIENEVSYVKDVSDLKNLKNKLMNYYDFTGLTDNDYVKKFLEVYEAWADSLVKPNFDKNNDVGSYAYVDPYFNMEKNFVANLYNINTLMHNKTIGGSDNE